MPDRFIGKKICEVHVNSEQRLVSFKSGSKLYQVREILRQWQDYDYSSLAPRRNWRSRRHRNFFHVLTENGQCFELYCDRGTRLESPRNWVLTREILNSET